MGVLKVIFIILLILFPFGQITRLEFQNGVAVTLLDVAVGVEVVLFILIKKSKQIFKNSLTKPIIIFAAVSLLSLLVKVGGLSFSEFIISSLYGIRWILYAGIFFVVSGFDAEFKKIITKIMIFIGSLVVLAGYLQYFLYPNLRNLYYLGWDEHLYRMFSSFFDPNFAGAFFVLYFILAFGLTLEYLKSNKKNYTLLLSVLSIITIIAILLTYSRSALIMLITGSISLFILKNKKKLIFFILGIAVIFFIIASRNFYIENLNLLRTASGNARLESASNALVIIRDNPILGVGFNSYRYAKEKYGFSNKENGTVSHSAAGTDNSFLFVLATTGVIGLLSYSYLWYKILKNQSVGLMTAVVKASVIGIFVNAFFINSLFYPSIMLWLWILIGLNNGVRKDPLLDSK